jgi:hypothetical protein
MGMIRIAHMHINGIKHLGYACHQWSARPACLELSNSPILQDKGKVSALEARLKAGGEYEVYRQRQGANYISDFDREIRRIRGQEKP